MAGKSAIAGWDVLFFMDGKQVNDNLYDQYIDRKDDPSFFQAYHIKADGKVPRSPEES